MGQHGPRTNGHASNPMIKRMLDAQEAEQQFIAMQFNQIPGAGPSISVEGVVDYTSQDGETTKLIKQMFLLPTGPMAFLYSVDFAEQIANSLLEKVRLARSGIITP